MSPINARSRKPAGVETSMLASNARVGRIEHGRDHGPGIKRPSASLEWTGS